MGLPSAIKKALKLSGAAYLLSALPVVFLADQLKSEVAIGKFISGEITFYFGTFAVFLCWELDHHLHQVCFLNLVIQLLICFPVDTCWLW